MKSALLKLTLLFLYITTVVDAIAFHVNELPEVMFMDHDGPLDENALHKIEISETLIVKYSNITNLHGHFANRKLPLLKKFVFIKCFFDMDEQDMADFFKAATNFIEIHVHQYDSYVPMLDQMRSDVAEKIIMTNNVYPKLTSRLLSNTKLKLINLARNKIHTIDDNAFTGLDHAEIMILNSNEIKTLKKSQMEDLKNLKQLHLRENLIEKIDVQEIPVMPNLEKVDIAENPLKELKLDGIEIKAPKLNHIDISGTIFTEEVEDLRKKHPKINFKIV